MERRFAGVSRDIERRRDDGEPLDRLTASATSSELVAALAAAGADDPVAASLLATELLDRLHRAPFLGAFLVGAMMAVAIVVLDLAFTRTLLVFEAGGPAHALLGLALAISVASGIAFFAWRGIVHAPALAGGRRGT